MKIRVLGGGIYGSHIAAFFAATGHQVELHEKESRLFAGASGNMPARLHCGSHYPRSKLTRAACQQHWCEFMATYGDFTAPVPVNLYAIAEHDSLVDYGTYRQILSTEIPFFEMFRLEDFGVQHVEGALWVNERHVLVNRLRDYFTELLKPFVVYQSAPSVVDDPGWDLTIDTTFCANDSTNIDRYEACLTLLLEGPANMAVTVMDGPFPSLYPWDEEYGLSSLTSAQHTPMLRAKFWGEAHAFLADLSTEDVNQYAKRMLNQMAFYFPRLNDEYRVVDYRFGIRAMPYSFADARLIDIVKVGDHAIRVRAGKLDAIFHAARFVAEKLPEFVR